MEDTILSVVGTAVEVLAGVHIAALVVVNLTPTPADDAFVAKFYRWVEILAGFVTQAAKAQPGSALENAPKLQKVWSVFQKSALLIEKLRSK